MPYSDGIDVLAPTQSVVITMVVQPEEIELALSCAWPIDLGRARASRLLVL
jgi:hypothetical protein